MNVEIINKSLGTLKFNIHLQENFSNRKKITKQINQSLRKMLSPSKYSKMLNLPLLNNSTHLLT